MLFGRPQILTDRQDVAARGAKIAKAREQLVVRLAQIDHDTALQRRLGWAMAWFLCNGWVLRDGDALGIGSGSAIRFLAEAARPY